MTAIGVLQILLLVAIVAAIAPFLGDYMVRVFEGRSVFLSPVLRPAERAIYRLSGVRERREQSWAGYLTSVIFFSVAGLVITYLLLRFRTTYRLTLTASCRLGRSSPSTRPSASPPIRTGKITRAKRRSVIYPK